MALLSIEKYPSPVLKAKAEPVQEIDDRLQKLIDDMAETMYAAPGIGLAANQVGVLQRVIVFDPTPKDQGRNLQVLINPRIVAASGQVIHEEGCLSIPDYSSQVKRYACVTVEGLDREGRPVCLEATDLLAIVLQHEIDHLDGILFIDRLSPLKRSLYHRQLRKKLRS